MIEVGIFEGEEFTGNVLLSIDDATYLRDTLSECIEQAKTLSDEVTE